MAYPKFKAAGAEVLGISPDTAETLARYQKEKNTPFSFVSDRSRTIANAFGMKGRRQPRVSYVIARGGIVASVSAHEIRVPKHILDTLATVTSLG